MSDFSEAMAKLKDEKKAFDKRKQKYEEKGWAGDLRSGRIDPVDMARAAFQSWWMGLNQERDTLEQMGDMFDALYKAIEIVVKDYFYGGPKQLAPDGDPEAEKKYFEGLKNFLEKIDRSFKNDSIAEGDINYYKDGNLDWEKIANSPKYKKDLKRLLDAVLSSHDKVKETAEREAAERGSNSVPTNDPIRLFGHGIKKLDTGIKTAKNKISKLNSGKNKAVEYGKAAEELEKLRNGRFKKLDMSMKWIKRDTESNMEAESEKGKDKHEKKLVDVKKDYDRCVNDGIDLLIDAYENTDSDKQKKIITPRVKQICLALQRMTDKDLLKESRKEVEIAHKSVMDELKSSKGQAGLKKTGHNLW